MSFWAASAAQAEKERCCHHSRAEDDYLSHC